MNIHWSDIERKPQKFSKAGIRIILIPCRIQNLYEIIRNIEVGDFHERYHFEGAM